MAACNFVKELAITFGKSFDPFVEPFFTQVVKLTALTKKIVAQAADAIGSVLIQHATTHTKLFPHLQLAVHDKNVYPRACVGRWLYKLLVHYTDQRAGLESSVHVIEEILRVGVTDPNPAVRASMRDAFWKFGEVWPGRNEA